MHTTILLNNIYCKEDTPEMNILPKVSTIEKNHLGYASKLITLYSFQFHILLSLTHTNTQPLLDLKEPDLKKLGIQNSKDRARMLGSLANYRADRGNTLSSE